MRSDVRYAPRAGKRRSTSGFTLAEVLVVVICVAIAGMLVVPQVADQSATRLSAAARLLEADLAYAQAQSLANGDDPRLMVFDPAGNRYWIAPRSTPDAPIINPVGREPYLTRFGTGRAATLQGIRLGTLSLGGDNALLFGIHGELDQPTPARITLTTGTRSVDITIHPITGQTSVSKVY